MARSNNEADVQERSTSLLQQQPFEPRAVRYSLKSANLHEDDFAEFFTKSLDLLCIIGLDGVCLEAVNPAWTNWLGWPIEDLLGRPLVDFVLAEDRDSTITEFAKLADGGPAVFLENRLRHRDGSYRWLQWSARSHPSQSRIYASARDITRRKQHELEILEIVDRERGRLGQEMHDGLCQSLAGIAALSSALSRKLAASPSAVTPAYADEISKLLKDAIGDAHDMAHGLDPLGMDDAGLKRALETLAVNVHHLFGVSCLVACNYESNGLPKESEIHLYRIVQEAISNSVNHGCAGQILINLSCENNEGILSVEDNGSGLPTDSFQFNGMGLKTMAYRASLIEGSLEVRRRQEQGTVVTCTFPLAG